MTIQYGTEKERKKFYRGKDWEQVRQFVLNRDNRECQHCKKHGRVHVDSVKQDGERKSIQLNVDHIEELHDRPELALDPDNLQTLCLRCHNEKHGRFHWRLRNKNKWADDEAW